MFGGSKAPDIRLAHAVLFLLLCGQLEHIVDGEAWKLVSKPKAHALRKEQTQQPHHNLASKVAAQKLGSKVAELNLRDAKQPIGPVSGNESPVTSASSSSAPEQRENASERKPTESCQNSVLMTLMEVRKRYQSQRQQHGAGGDSVASSAGQVQRDPLQHHPAWNVHNRSTSNRETPGVAAVREAAPVSPLRMTRAPTTPVAEAEGEDSKEGEECIICAETLGSKLVGRVSCNSSHFFCFDCIHHWGTDCENSCPLCKQSFSSIDKLAPAPLEPAAGRRLGDNPPAMAAAFSQKTYLFGGIKWRVVGTVHVEDKRQRADDEYAGEGEEDGCEGCRRLGLLILCDLCDQGYCLPCANLTEQTVPAEHEPWYCRECGAAEVEEEEREAQEGTGARRRGEGGGRGRRQQRGRAGRARAVARELGGRYRMAHGESRDRTVDGFVVEDDDVEQDQDWTPEALGLVDPPTRDLEVEVSVGDDDAGRVYPTRSNGCRSAVQQATLDDWNTALRSRRERGQGDAGGATRRGVAGTGGRTVGKRQAREGGSSTGQRRRRRTEVRTTTMTRRRRGRRRGEDESDDAEWVPIEDAEAEEDFELTESASDYVGNHDDTGRGRDRADEDRWLSVESEESGTVSSSSVDSAADSGEEESSDITGSG